jgi:trimethylamine---corrinoid protein Co-methyltransferase
VSGSVTDAAIRRRGGRSRNGASTGTHLPQQRPWAQPTMRLNHTGVLSADELEGIHHASLAILERIGMDIWNGQARAMWRDAGATVDEAGRHVWFPPQLVEQLVARAPEEFTLHAWNPAHNLRIGGRTLSFGTVASAPNVVGLDGVRRSGTRASFQDLLRLAQSLNAVHFIAGYPVEPGDTHVSVRHLNAAFDVLTLTDKAMHCYSLGAQKNRDCMEMVRLARGVSNEQFEREPSIFSVINSNSPLRLDGPMLEGIIEMSARNQVIVMTPFTLAGAMAPITLAGALAQQNAEALAGIAFCQLVRPGSPVVYGGFTSNVDMQSGAPAFGTPEYVKAAMVGGQLARRYRLPYRSSNVCAANAVDAQAAYESVFSLWGAAMGGVNMLMHGAGWMEGGLHASLAKMVLDADLLQMVSTMMDPVVVDTDSLALDAIAEVGPGGHFFGVGHTQDRFRAAFYRPLLSDWRNYETWHEAGRPEAAAKANTLAAAFIDAYEQPEMPADRTAALADFYHRRLAEGGVTTDF